MLAAEERDAAAELLRVAAWLAATDETKLTFVAACTQTGIDAVGDVGEFAYGMYCAAWDDLWTRGSISIGDCTGGELEAMLEGAQRIDEGEDPPAMYLPPRLHKLLDGGAA